MSRGPSDRELDRLLADLPRPTASPSFTRRVLSALEAPTPTRPGARRRWLLAGAAAALAIVALLWVPLRGRVAPPPATEMGALREEHRLLMEELAALKASLRESEAPVLYLGGTESLDLVLDLGPIWGARGDPGVRPAALTPGGEAPLRPRPAEKRNGGQPR